MLKPLSLIELLLSLGFLLVSIWALSGLCAGRPCRVDCESWFIFGVNMFSPVGALGVVCAAWSLKRGSWGAQVILGAGCLVVMAYGVLHA
jgi:hypothetical protein